MNLPFLPSKLAHWPPFMRTGVEYIREKYNNATWEHDSVAQVRKQL
jgi:hypothetical protein